MLGMCVGNRGNWYRREGVSLLCFLAHLFHEKGVWRRGDSFAPSKGNKSGFPQNVSFVGNRRKEQKD